MTEVLIAIIFLTLAAFVGHWLHLREVRRHWMRITVAVGPTSLWVGDRIEIVGTTAIDTTGADFLVVKTPDSNTLMIERIDHDQK